MTIRILVNIYNSSNIIWFSFILCLIYLGGVLILFIYISSFLPNRKFSSFSIIIIFPFWIVVLLWLEIESKNINFNFSINFNYLLRYNIIFESRKWFFLVFSVFYLILVLLISVYYSSFNKIPLRRIR
jgi:NADH-ubiquinone oxidoreductase chain 6